MDGNNMRIKTLFLTLICGTVLSFAQIGSEPFNQLLTLRDSTLVTDSTTIVTGLTPIALLCLSDSMDEGTTATFEVSFGANPSRTWFVISDLEDTSNYTIPIPKDTAIFIPLNPIVFNSIIGISKLNNFDAVWIRVRVANAQDGDQHFYLRQRRLN